MLRAILARRAVVALLMAAIVGAWGLHALPVPGGQFVPRAHCRAQAPRVPGVGLWLRDPVVHHAVSAGLDAHVSGDDRVFRSLPSAAYRALPPCPEPDARPAPMLVLGEAHHATTPGRAPEPTWLTIPQRGLCTGIMILGAIGTGKTPACMYPYPDQLLRWRRHDPAQKLSGLVLEVKGDF